MTNQSNSSWTEDLKGEVKTLWADHSATEIVMVFNERGYTFTRNAVIGVLHRAGLTANHKTEVHPSSNKNGGGQTAPRRSSANHVRRPKIDAATIQLRCFEIVPRGLSLIDLEPGDCRYPYGDETITFCAHPAMVGSSYCVPHRHLCWGEGTISERLATKGIAA